MSSGLLVSQLSVAYETSSTVLSEISFSLAPGTVTLLLGPNASGKSTLLKALAGLLDYRGSALLQGHELSSCTRQERARKLAYVPQRTQLNAPLKVQQVVAMARYGRLEGKGEQDRVVRRAMEQADCVALAKRSFLTLSGGQRQQVLLARALATEAKVLLLDEPSAALDIRHTLGLARQLSRLASEGYLIFWAMHDLALASKCAQRCVVLHERDVAADGPLQQVLTDTLFDRVFGVQMTPRTGPGFSLFAGECGER